MRVLALLLLGVCLAGCAVPADLAGGVREALARDDPERALALLERWPDPQSALWQMERGLLLRATGKLEASNAAFAVARVRREELYTRSLSNEAAALAASDLVRPYRPAEFEVPFLYIYPILNYLELGDLAGALVEARALSEEAEVHRDRRPGASRDWGPGRLLAGLVFEAGGAWNDAWVAYGAADAAWAGPGDGPGPETRAWLADAIRRASVAAGLESGEVGPARARVVVWIEEGLVPPKEELRLRLPVLREEEHWAHGELGVWSERLGRRAADLRSGAVSWCPGDVLDWIEVALPVHPDLPVPPLPVPSVCLGAAAPVAALPLADVAAAARDDLGRAFPGVAARAAARALLKRLAVGQATSRAGDWGGRVAALLGVVTERADTRGWSTLPARISLAVLEVAPGDVRVEARPAAGAACVGEFAIGPGGWHFLSCRCE